MYVRLCPSKKDSENEWEFPSVNNIAGKNEEIMYLKIYTLPKLT